MGGVRGQSFLIGSGGATGGISDIWLEIAYRVNGAQVFYTRNFLDQEGLFESVHGDREAYLEKFISGEVDCFGFGDWFPETSLVLERKKYTTTDHEGKEKTFQSGELVISADVGAVFGMAAPGERMIDIRLKEIPLDDGVQFMRGLVHEIAAAQRGEHPDPGNFPAGSSEWPFIRQLNQQSYNLISETYQEQYFSNPLLTSKFEQWMADLPGGGRILDAGCGHGDPIVARLLDSGFSVSGIDLSPEMLERARKNFPGASFSLKTVSELQVQAEFDGVCSLSSLLYLDPIDLYNSIYRLYHALKPGGLLFLYAYDLHPDWRGRPLDQWINQWMWSWTYSMSEAVHMLEEHGYFKVIEAENVTAEEEKESLLEKWRQNKQKDYEDMVKKYYSTREPPPPPDLTIIPDSLSNCYVIIARRQ